MADHQESNCCDHPCSPADVLEKKLSHRPKVEDLVEHNILKPCALHGVSETLHSTQAVLERELLRNQLNRKLHERPERSELVGQHIIEPTKEDVRELLAETIVERPSLEELKAKHIIKSEEEDRLEHERRAEVEKKLGQFMQNRPPVDYLKDHNIYPDANLAGPLQRAARDLEKQMKEDELNRWLSHRPDVDELKQRHILTVEEQAAADAAAVTAAAAAATSAGASENSN